MREAGRQASAHLLRKRQVGPASPAGPAGTLGTACLSGPDRGALTSRLPQKPEDREREWLIISWGSGVTCLEGTLLCLGAVVINAFLRSGESEGPVALAGPKSQVLSI